LKVKEIEDSGDFEDIIDWKDKITEYISSLVEVCKSHENLSKRRMISFLKSRHQINYRDQDILQLISNWKKLPISENNKQEFKSSIETIFAQFYTHEMINQIIENSFDVNAVGEDVKLLNFDFEHSADIGKAFYKLFSLYKSQAEFLKDKSDKNNKNLQKPKNQKVNKRGFKRADFLPQLDHLTYGQATQKLNIAKIMFLTFPQVRDNFSRYTSKKKVISLEGYLRIVSRNIRQ
jgi:hypothetical protein